MVATPASLNTTMSTSSRDHTTIYRKTGVFPDGTIFFKELQLTLGPAENPDGSRTEPSGRGYFPGAFNGADVTVKDTKRFADTGGWGYFNFNHHEPKALTARCNQSRIVRFAISPPPRETRCGRSSTAYWTRSPFRKGWHEAGWAMMAKKNLAGHVTSNNRLLNPPEQLI